MTRTHTRARIAILSLSSRAANPHPPYLTYPHPHPHSLPYPTSPSPHPAPHPTSPTHLTPSPSPHSHPGRHPLARHLRGRRSLPATSTTRESRSPRPPAHRAAPRCRIRREWRDALCLRAKDKILTSSRRSPLTHLARRATVGVDAEKRRGRRRRPGEPAAALRSRRSSCSATACCALAPLAAEARFSRLSSPRTRPGPGQRPPPMAAPPPSLHRARHRAAARASPPRPSRPVGWARFACCGRAT